ncbi:MAG: hypothetical protein ACOYI5_06190 [Christensenellales bacterium]|jgi:hypothetical protein
MRKKAKQYEAPTITYETYVTDTIMCSGGAPDNDHHRNKWHKGSNNGNYYGNNKKNKRWHGN